MDSSTDSSSSSSEEEPQECENADAISKINDFPEKSRERYLKTYELFIEWRFSKGFQSFSEDVLLTYFKELAATKQASTLWTMFSMLRSTINAHHGVEINTYSKLMSYLKSQSKGQTTRKYKIFTIEDVETFLNDAPDNIFLVMKIALVFGICGACRPLDLVRLRTRDIQKHSDQVMLVNVMKNPKLIDRSFIVQEKYIPLIEKYLALRPPSMNSDRFFVYYKNGECKKQYIGKNTISFYAKRIAVFLKLPGAHLYNGHCFKRAASLFQSQSGHNPLIIKQSRRWMTEATEDLVESATMTLRSADSTQEIAESPINAQRPESSVDAQFAIDALDGTQEVKLETECPADESVMSDDRSECEIPRSSRRVSPIRRPASSSLIAALERRRLRLDEVRARQLHSREMARLRVEERRIEVDQEKNEVLRRIADVALALLERTMGNGVIPRS